MPHVPLIIIISQPVVFYFMEMLHGLFSRSPAPNNPRRFLLITLSSVTMSSHTEHSQVK